MTIQRDILNALKAELSRQDVSGELDNKRSGGEWLEGYYDLHKIASAVANVITTRNT